MDRPKSFRRRERMRLRAEIEDTARERLQACPYPAVKRLGCEFNGGSLILSGRVTTFFEKQVAQETVGCLEGVEQLVNGVEVAS